MIRVFPPEGKKKKKKERGGGYPLLYWGVLNVRCTEFR